MDMEAIFRDALAQADRDYSAARADEVRRLHNRIAEVIAEERPSPPNALLALEIAKAKKADYLADEIRRRIESVEGKK